MPLGSMHPSLEIRPRSSISKGVSGWSMFPFSQQNFPCIPLFPKTLKVFFFRFWSSLFPKTSDTAFVPLIPALFSFCSLVPSFIFLLFPFSQQFFFAMFLCSLKPVGEPHFPLTSLHPFLEIKLGSSISH